MGTAIIVVASIACGLCLLMYPRSGFFLIWLTICVFPHNLWWNLQIPLNVGFDDCLIVLWWVAALLTPSTRLQRGASLAVGFGLFLFFAVCLGNLTGYLYYAKELAGLGQANLKEVLKLVTFLMAAHAAHRLIRDWKDLERSLLGLVTGLTAGAILALVSSRYPSIMNVFGSARAAQLARWSTILGSYRVAGPFMEPIAAAVVTILGLCLIPYLWSVMRYSKRVFLVLAGLTFLVTAMMTGTRTSLIAIGAMLLCVPFLAGTRKLAIALVAAAVVTFSLTPLVSSVVVERLLAGGFYRLEIWRDYLGSLDLRRLLLGQSQWPGIVYDGNGFQAHNGFLDLLCYYGVWGLAAGTLLLCYFAVLLRRIKATGHPYADALFSSGLLFLVAFLVFSMTTETTTPQSLGLRLLLFVLVTFERAHRLAISDVQVEAEQWHWVGSPAE